MARFGVSLLLLAALAALASSVPVVRRDSSPNPLKRLDDFTRTLAPDMADPLPPQQHSRPRPQPQLKAASSDPYRLEDTKLMPILYQITLKPDFTKFTFTGEAIIVVNCHENTDTITLHSRELTFSSASIYDDSFAFWPSFTSKSIVFDKEHDLAIIKLDGTMKKGLRYQILISYTGILNDDLSGFYRSSYKTSTGETRWLGVTQFEQVGARRAFPCWDEPSYKARFVMLITHDSTRNVLSNMEIVATENAGGGYVREQFDATLPISTYLIAFVVSDFESLKSSKGELRTWARKDIVAGATTANDVAWDALSNLSKYTGIGYALDKMDQAAIPDFAAGAMENWGLVTYREEYLIEVGQDIRIEESISTTVCHELGHQWTGDLVTLDWWSHTWLNEGFADYFESTICDMIKPDWHLRDKYVTADAHRGMEYDALETQVAMSSPVSTPVDADSKFDRISYSKGGAVIRMWEYFLGQDVLKAGMKRYLNINMFKNTNPEHLFQAIDFEAKKAGVLPGGLSFSKIARTWTEQPGVPVVNVVRDYNTNTLTLTQKRFFYTKPNREALVDERWHIPVTVVEKPNADWDNLKPSVWLKAKDKSTTYKLKATLTEWVVVNPKEIGYYRVNYDVKNWNMLAKELMNKVDVFPAATRAQLINDAMALARAKELDYEVALQFLNTLKADRDVTPWKAGVTALDYLRTKLAGTGAWSSYLAFLKKVTDAAYKAVGFSGVQAHETRFLRYYVVSYACYAGNDDCISKANDVLKKWLADSTTKPDPDTKAVSLCYGLRGADAAANFAGLKAKMAAETDANARSSLISALACAKEDHLTGLLSDTINDNLSGVTQDDIVSLWQAILNRPEQTGILFKWAKKNVQLIDSYFSSTDADSGAVKLLTKCIQSITTPEQLTDARWFVEDNYRGQNAYDAFQKTFLEVYKGLGWYRDNYEKVSKWISTNSA